MTIHLNWSWPLFFVMFIVAAILHLPWLVRDIRRALAEDRAEKAAREGVDKGTSET